MSRKEELRRKEGAFLLPAVNLCGGVKLPVTAPRHIKKPEIYASGFTVFLNSMYSLDQVRL